MKQLKVVLGQKENHYQIMPGGEGQMSSWSLGEFLLIPGRVELLVPR